jgi:hypothetical protein
MAKAKSASASALLDAVPVIKEGAKVKGIVRGKLKTVFLSTVVMVYLLELSCLRK